MHYPLLDELLESYTALRRRTFKPTLIEVNEKKETKEDKKEEAPKENPDIILKASNSPYFVKIDRSQIARLIKLEKKTLIKTKEEDRASLEVTDENKKKMQAKLDVEKGTIKR